MNRITIKIDAGDHQNTPCLWVSATVYHENGLNCGMGDRVYTTDVAGDELLKCLVSMMQFAVREFKRQADRGSVDGESKNAPWTPKPSTPTRPSDHPERPE